VRGDDLVGCLHCDPEDALDALEFDAVVRSWFSKDLLEYYLSLKRTEISLLDGADPKVACERYLRVY
jgi:glutamine synthetase